MGIFARLTEKSWENPGAPAADPATYRPEAKRVGLVVYLCVAAMLFALLASAYLMRMGVLAAVGSDGAHAPVRDWAPIAEPPLIWINTGVLVASSFAWELARMAAREGRPDLVRRAFISAGALGLLFLGGQLLLWQDYADAGYFMQSNPASSFFYLITALHGLHIAGGLYFWVRALLRKAALPVDLCAAYWHFLLLIWLAMLVLLVLT